MDRSPQPGPSKSRRDTDRPMRMDRSPSPGPSKSKRDSDRAMRMDLSPQPGPSKSRRDTDRTQRKDRSPQPGPSKPRKNSDSDIELPEKDEEKEPPPKPKYEAFEKTIDFFCELCKMKEKCHYYGKEPPFATRIEFLEDCYVLRDPFAPPPFRAKSKPEYFLVLGSKCCKCNRTVCKDTECSFFYEHTYCMDCMNKNLKSFPVEVQTKVKKLLTK